jgi:hypothetical protein
MCRSNMENVSELRRSRPAVAYEDVARWRRQFERVKLFDVLNSSRETDDFS